jgi:hypothetical protein|tara:strand:- start:36 stop:341 length:306 start_codon:yes stop_codon:yes gene_type:complete
MRFDGFSLESVILFACIAWEQHALLAKVAAVPTVVFVRMFACRISDAERVVVPAFCTPSTNRVGQRPHATCEDGGDTASDDATISRTSPCADVEARIAGYE